MCYLLINLLLLITLSYSKLYQVYSLSRHGSRYHAVDFYDSNDTLPLKSQLTAVGMRQLQRFGQLLRKQYIDSLKFLSPKYNRSQIQVYTTHTNRTFMSIQSLLYGLYPPGTGPRLTYVDRYLHLPPYSNKTDADEQNFAVPNAHQPIKVINNEKMIISDCPNYSKYEKQNFQKINDIVAQMNTYYQPFMKRMSTLFNFTLVGGTADLLSMTRCYDVALVNTYLGRPLPSGFTQEDFDNVQHFANWYFQVSQSNQNNLMDNTFKFQKIISDFDLRVKLPDTYALKWTFVSGHDTDVLAMYYGLNISSYTCTQELFRKGKTSSVQCQQGGVKFAANIIVQLHSDDGKSFYVKVRSNGKYMRICSKSKLECDYTQFKALLKKSIASNIDDICGKKIKPFGYGLQAANINPVIDSTNHLELKKQ